MRRFLINMRFLGWFWMLLLVGTTLAADDDAHKGVVVSAMVLATVWVGVTWWAAQRWSRVTSRWFLAADGVVCLAIGSASYVANAGDLFHGDYPISWLVVLAYGRGTAIALLGSVMLVLQQSTLLLGSGRSSVLAVGSIVFVLYAVIFGWLFGMIRRSDRERRRTAVQLAVERDANARRLERLELANRLHDSALQTLQVIDAEAEDAIRVRSLARRQTRELRYLVETYSSNHQVMFSTEIARIAAVEDRAVTIYIRDEGRGFDINAAESGHGIESSIRGRMAEIGGEVSVESRLGEGTEVKLSAARTVVTA